ncbi:unnamed protein product [Fusarium graminearum]|nr:unnamed protein product [Fusarium graminearum]
MLQNSQGIVGTAPFTRLLASADMHPDQVAAMVAWPRHLERLAMQTNPKLMTTTSVHEGSLQHILDIPKDSLTHFRIEGDYELGMRGFDLRDFPCLEHLALCNATIFGRDPGRPQDTFPDHYQHILAPHLRSLLWVMPPTQWDAEILSGVLHGMLALMQIMDMVSKERLEHHETRKEPSLERIWLQILKQPLESLAADAQDKFATHLGVFEVINHHAGSRTG